MTGTIVFTEAGNVTYIKGQKPVDIEPLLTAAIRDKVPFVYLHDAHEPDNRVCVAPRHVAALVQHD